jgi:hypothetical protein
MMGRSEDGWEDKRTSHKLQRGAKQTTEEGKTQTGVKPSGFQRRDCITSQLQLEMDNLAILRGFGVVQGR